jgi:hypothetical protein
VWDRQTNRSIISHRMFVFLEKVVVVVVVEF